METSELGDDKDGDRLPLPYPTINLLGARTSIIDTIMHYPIRLGGITVLRYIVTPCSHHRSLALCIYLFNAGQDDALIL